MSCTLTEHERSREAVERVGEVDQRDHSSFLADALVAQRVHCMCDDLCASLCHSELMIGDLWVDVLPGIDSLRSTHPSAKRKRAHDWPLVLEFAFLGFEQAHSVPCTED